MVRNQGPGVALRLGFFEDVGEPFQESLSVFVIAEDISSFYSPGHDVLEEAWGVKSWLAGHYLFLLRRWHGLWFEPVSREEREGCFGFSGSGFTDQEKKRFWVWVTGYSSAP